MRRSATPSELPDFPEYQECWDERKSPSDVDPDVEKSLKDSEATFYEESSDVEDEIEVAKSAVVRTTVIPQPPKSKSSKRWWK
jgi:hypothetical protein